MGMSPLPLTYEQMRKWVSEWMKREARSAKLAGERSHPRVAPAGDFEFAEAFQISGYGTRPTEEWLGEMFRFT